MSYNQKRAAAMQQKSNQELLDIWMSMSLSSAAAAYVLAQRSIVLPARLDANGKPIGRRRGGGELNIRCECVKSSKAKS